MFLILLESIGFVFGFATIFFQYCCCIAGSKKIRTHVNSWSRVHVVIVHGLGGSSMPSNSLFGLRVFLQNNGFPNVSLFEYNSFRLSVKDAAQLLEQHIDELMKAQDYTSVFVVGFSAGGRVALLCSNKTVDGIVAVTSPIQGSATARLVTALWPTILSCPPMLKDLRQAAQFSSTTPRHAAVSAEMLLGFGGKVRVCEMSCPTTATTVHLRGVSHNFCQIDPRCHRGAPVPIPKP